MRRGSGRGRERGQGRGGRGRGRGYGRGQEGRGRRTHGHGDDRKQQQEQKQQNVRGRGATGRRGGRRSGRFHHQNERNQRRSTNNNDTNHARQNPMNMNQSDASFQNWVGASFANDNSATTATNNHQSPTTTNCGNNNKNNPSNHSDINQYDSSNMSRHESDRHCKDESRSSAKSTQRTKNNNNNMLHNNNNRDSASRQKNQNRTTINNGDDDKNANGNEKKERRRTSRTKKKNYTTYETLAACMERYLARDQSLIRGTIRVLPGREARAFVTCDRGSFSKDVLVETTHDRNRALDGDQVFVQIIATEEKDVEVDSKPSIQQGMESLNIEQDTEEEEEFRNDDDDEEMWQYNDDDDDEIQASLWNPMVDIPRDLDHRSAERNQQQQQQARGRVIHVIPPKNEGLQPSEIHPARNNNRKLGAPRRLLVGTIKRLGPSRKGEEDKKTGKQAPMHLFTPNNKSLPQFLCPSHFEPQTTSNDEDLSQQFYQAEYVYGTWREEHHWPPCTKVKPMGTSGNVEDETMALLIENDVLHGDFTSDVLKNVQDAVESGLEVVTSDASQQENNDSCPEQDVGWRPTPSMYEGRRDYRHRRIFTIDPTTAKDLDDALHIEELPDGRVEIGVHIADVSFFVQPETPVDIEASRRTTTVYLVDRVLPMLPKALCEIACSLNENVERLAFSCVWRMNKDGTLADKKKKKGKRSNQNPTQDVWFGRTIIKSCARLDYATAQNIIEGKVVASNDNNVVDNDNLWPQSRRPTHPHSMDAVAADVRLMHKVAMARRKLRFRHGAIALNGTKLAFELDAQTPTLCAPYPIRDSNRLVEEFMLLANYLVSQRLITHVGAPLQSKLGSFALLRHHPEPLMGGMDKVVEVAKESIGFNIDTSSSQSLQMSLNRLGRRHGDNELVMQCITELLMTPMVPADYIRAGAHKMSEWRHYALNIPYYTHFTSPIRRYPDIIVHRLLAYTLNDQQDDDGDYDTKYNEEEDDDDDDAKDIPHAAIGMTASQLEATCERCNVKRMGSKKAQDRSDRVFLALYLKRNFIPSTMGIVLSVGESTLTVFVADLGVSSKVFMEEHDDWIDYTTTATKNSGSRRMELVRKEQQNNDWNHMMIKTFTKLQISVGCKERPPIDIKSMIKGPWKE